MSMFTLYRAYGFDGNLLYIGATKDIEARICGHRSTKNWWPQVAVVEREVYLDVDSLANAERAAIKMESPRYNRGGAGIGLRGRLGHFTDERKAVLIRLDPDVLLMVKLLARLDDSSLQAVTERAISVWATGRAKSISLDDDRLSPRDLELIGRLSGRRS